MASTSGHKWRAPSSALLAPVETAKRGGKEESEREEEQEEVEEKEGNELGACVGGAGSRSICSP